MTPNSPAALVARESVLELPVTRACVTLPQSDLRILMRISLGRMGFCRRKILPPK